MPNSYFLLTIDYYSDVLTNLIFDSSTMSVRDLLTWVTFMNITRDYLTPPEGFFHGAHLVFVDALGCGGSVGSAQSKEEVLTHLKMLLEQCGLCFDRLHPLVFGTVIDHDQGFGIPPFYIDSGIQFTKPITLIHMSLHIIY